MFGKPWNEKARIAELTGLVDHQDAELSALRARFSDAPRDPFNLTSHTPYDCPPSLGSFRVYADQANAMSLTGLLQELEARRVMMDRMWIPECLRPDIERAIASLSDCAELTGAPWELDDAAEAEAWFKAATRKDVKP